MCSNLLNEGSSNLGYITILLQYFGILFSNLLQEAHINKEYFFINISYLCIANAEWPTKLQRREMGKYYISSSGSNHTRQYWGDRNIAKW